MNAFWIKYLPEFLRKRLEGRPQFQNVIGNSGWLFADRIFRMGTGLVVSVWVTRYLGPQQFGQLNYALAFVAIFSSIATLGLDSIVVRNIIREPSRQNEMLGSSFVLRLIGGALTLVISLAVIALLRPADHLTQILVGIIALGTIFQAVTNIDFWFQSKVQSKYSAYARSAANVVICIVKVVLIFFHAPLIAFASAGVAEIALISLGIVIAYKSNGQFLTQWQASRSLALELLRDSWPLFLSEIVMLIYLRIDRVMIGDMSGNQELGIYSVAAMLAEAFYFIPLIVYSSVFPSIVKAREEGEEYFYKILQKYYNLMALLAYAVALPVTILSGWLIPLMFGDVYSRASLMLTGLIWAGLFYNLMVARSQFLTTMNWTRLHFITDFMGAALNVVLNFTLIPRYGGMGAVFASFVSYWFVAHGSCFLYKPLFRTGIMISKAMVYPKIW